MKKNVLTMLMLGAVALLVSCGNSKSTPQEIDGFEFTGEGIFENLPYIIAYRMLDPELKDINDPDISIKEEIKKEKTFFKEYHDAIEDAVKRLDGKDVSFERCVGGKTEEVKGFKLKVKDRSTVSIVDGDELFTYTQGVTLELVPPEGYNLGKEHIDGYTHFNRILPLDKDGIPVSLNMKVDYYWYKSKYGCSFKPRTYPLERANNKERMLTEMSEYDHVAKLVEVDEAAYEEYAKKAEEAATKKVEEEAEENRSKEFTFAEDGFAGIVLGAKFNNIPKSFEGLYMQYKTEHDPDMGILKYSFYNGEELMFMAQGFTSDHKINSIAIFSDRISVKTEDGKTVKTGMKLADVVKDFTDNCSVSWTGDEISPVIHVGQSINFNTTDATFTPSFLKRVKDIEGSFEDVLPVTAVDISPDEKVKSIVLAY